MVAEPKQVQFSIKTLLLLLFFSALVLRMVVVNQNFLELSQELSPIGELGGKALELKTRLGYLPLADLRTPAFVPIPPIEPNSRRFRLFIPSDHKKRVLNLGMTDGNARYLLPDNPSEWPIVRSFEISNAEEQVVVVSWQVSAAGAWVIRIQSNDLLFPDVDFADSDVLSSPNDWQIFSSDVQRLATWQPGVSFNLWELRAGKKTSNIAEAGQLSGFRIWLETEP